MDPEVQDSTQNTARYDSDSEWEYEYHPTETEIYYVTVDLSSLTNQALHGFKTTNDSLNSSKADKPRNEGIAPLVDTPAGASQQDGEEDSAALVDDDLETVQTINLASSNPLLYHKGRVYSCTWTDTIGTDLILASPGVHLPSEPLHSTANYQISAKSSIRLLGAPSKLVEQPDSLNGELSRPTYAESTRPSNTAPYSTDPYASTSTAPTFSIPLQATTRPQRKAQSAFLERFIEAKARRGEFDHVFLNKGRTYADCETDQPEAFNRGDGLVPWDKNIERPAKKTRLSAGKRARKDAAASSGAEKTSSALEDTEMGESITVESTARHQTVAPAAAQGGAIANGQASSKGTKKKKQKKKQAEPGPPAPLPVEPAAGIVDASTTAMTEKAGKARRSKDQANEDDRQVRFAAPIEFVFEEPGVTEAASSTKAKAKGKTKAGVRAEGTSKQGIITAQSADEEADGDVEMQDAE